jgi:NADPH-dependent glutamate synthase beta subunit-like oxidoreductase
MALRQLDYLTVASLGDAVDALAAAGGKATVLAGGTDLLGALKDNIHGTYPEFLVDLKGVPGLDAISVRPEGATIGALTTLAALAWDPHIREGYPLLAEAARSVASPQIRNRGTVGGNLCQQPRCWYYRHPEDGFHCLRKGGVRCAAVLGDHRFHSLFGAVRTAAPACAASCPGHVEIPVYLESMRRGDLDQAAKVVLRRNPMPAITGRVCPHRCESECNRSDLDETLSVRAIERHVGDYVLEQADTLMQPPAVESGKSVAVVGAGPAGLAAAYYLCCAGHRVTVFERMPEAGGMLAYGIPPYRLPRSVVQGQVQAYARMGIEFRTGVAVGSRGLSIRTLRAQFDAVFLATGAWRAKALDLPGAELLQSGLDLLFAVHGGQLPAVGRKVLVIGGGNVALDVGVTARRLGAAEVVVACLESRETMPAFPEDIEQALQEGISLLPSWGPERILTADGRLLGVRLVRCTSVFAADGSFRPVFDPTVTETVEADQVFLAIGQAADLGYTGRVLRTTDRGLIEVDPATGATGRARVYAGGEVTSGPASVIEAIAAGRRAAEAIAAELTAGAAADRASSTAASGEGLYGLNVEALRRSGRVCVPEVPPGERTLMGEDVATLGLPAVQQEAHRCVNCGCIAVNASDLAPALIALGATVCTTRRRLPAAEFFAAKPLGTTVLEPDELVTAIELPPPQTGTRQRYLKFRLRNAIDFPIASVAGVLGVVQGRIADARVVLGAVGPVPLRAAALEAFLVGRALSEETAYAAGELALQGACVLPRNRYKAQVVKGLLRRLLLP